MIQGTLFQKGGSSMNNQNVIVDWKLVIALGVAPAIVILALKLDPVAAERVLTALVSTHGGNCLALMGEC